MCIMNKASLLLLYLMICSNFIFDNKEYNIKSLIQLELGTLTTNHINHISSQSRNVKLIATTVWCEAFKILIINILKNVLFWSFVILFYCFWISFFIVHRWHLSWPNFSKDVNEVYVFYHLFSSHVIPFYYRLCTHLPEQKHQQSQNQDACENGHQDDPPGNSGVLSHGTLWGHCHFHLQWNATGRRTKISGELGPR